jgi:hypothetical protein
MKQRQFNCEPETVNGETVSYFLEIVYTLDDNEYIIKSPISLAKDLIEGMKNNGGTLVSTQKIREARERTKFY